MGNSHPSGRKTRLVYCSFRHRDFDVKFCQEPRDERGHWGGARKKFVARVESGKVMGGTFAPPGLNYQIGMVPRPIDVVTGRSGIRFSDAWRTRVRGSIVGIRSHFLGSIQRIAKRPGIGGCSDVEQWKQIPGKADSGTHALL